MAKKNRVEVRLSDDDYERLRQISADYEITQTEVIETLLRTARPTRIVGVRRVGRRGRLRLSIVFSNGMVVHGFLWSRGGQLLPPQVRSGHGFVPIFGAPPRIWRALRELCIEELGIENESEPLQSPDEAELINAAAQS